MRQNRLSQRANHGRGKPVVKNAPRSDYQGVLALLEEGLVMATILAAPLVMGGRTDLGRFAYVACVAALGLVWLWRNALLQGTPVRSTGVEWLLVAGASVLILQIVPLPESILRIVAPHLPEWLPLWCHSSRDAAVPTGLATLHWNQVSFAPELTRIALVVYVAHACFFLILCQRLRSLSDVEKLIRQLAFASIAMATIGLIQYLIGTDEYLGIFVHPSRVASEACTGPYSNANHFAHFLALGIGAAIVWLQQSISSGPNYGPTGNRRLGAHRNNRMQIAAVLLAGGLTMLLLAGFLTWSRGGMLAIALAVVLTVGQLAVRKLIGRGVVLVITGIMFLFATGLFIHGKDHVQEELDTLTAGSIDALDAGNARRNIWTANIQAAVQSSILGMGVGSHPFVYPRYFEHPTHVEYTHAESCYVQLFTETGCLGLGLVILGLLCLARWLWRATGQEDTRATVCWIAVVSGVITSCVHATVDFPWYLTSCMSLSVVLAAAAWSLAQLADGTEDLDAARDGEARPHRYFVLAIGAVAIVLAVPAMHLLWNHAIADVHWNQYLVQSLDKNVKREKRALLVSRTTEDHDKWQQQIAKRDKKMFASLDEVLRRTPFDCRANLRMATMLLQMVEERLLQSENAMGLAQIRDAANQSKFASVDAQRAWLQVVMGENLQLLDRALVHAQRALHACPLEAQGYLLWKELAMLQETTPDVSNLLLAQAARVRPHDAAVLLSIGRDAVMIGKTAEALPYWRKAFHQDEESAMEIIRIIAPRVDAYAFIEMFAPKERELTTLMYYYYKVGQPENMRKLLPLVIAQIEKRLESESGETAAKSRMKIVDHYTTLGDLPSAVKHAKLAVEAAPNLYEAHFALATQLVKTGDYVAAMHELSWCHRRRPRDKNLEQLYVLIKPFRQPSPVTRQVSHASH